MLPWVEVQPPRAKKKGPLFDGCIVSELKVAMGIRVELFASKAEAS